MSKPESVVIVGAGMAGANAAFALRDAGHPGRVVLIGNEDRVPYERPPLSKKYLRGEVPFEKSYVRQAADYEDQGIELVRRTAATRLNLDAHTVLLDNGSTVDYDALVLATGSEPRRIDIAGAELDGVHYLRNVEDSDAIRAAAGDAKQVAVIGGGWIGSEVAASLAEMGHAVSVIMTGRRPLEHVLGPEVAEVYRRLHEEHGVAFVRGRVAALEGSDRVAAVRLADGRRLAADLVVVGIGATPRVALAAGAGLALRDGGVEVDQFLRTSAPDVYAIGDIATAWHPLLGKFLRVEHWDNARWQGRAVGQTIAGSGEPYARTPYFYSDQFDLGMEYRGHAPRWDRVVIRGDLANREFHAFWLADGRVLAAMNANLWDDGDELLALVQSRERVDPSRLANPKVKLAEAA